MGLEDDGPNVKKEERIVVYQHINAPTDILPTRKKASRRLQKNSVRGFAQIIIKR
jgi:L-lysine 2,3-aminomutase